MEEPSKVNPEKFFNFKITPLNKFKLAIDALCERDFNPIGFGVIEVTENGVDFTARNVDTQDAGYLVLNSTALQDFQYTSKCKDRFMRVNFRKIYQIITVAESSNVDSITIFHIQGSNKLNFNFGNDPVKEYKFKQAIDALCERDFNPIGFGVTEVSENGVDFTARNVDTQDAGYLCLNSLSTTKGVLPSLPSILRQLYGRMQKSSNFWQSVPDFLKLYWDHLQGKQRKKGRRIGMKRPMIVISKQEEVHCSFCSMLLKKFPGQTFSFTVTQITKFKLAMDSLSDQAFNAPGHGVIQVTSNEVKFTVLNSNSKVTGFLCLHSTALLDFHCSSKCKDKLLRVNLRKISKILTVAEGSSVDSVTVFHVDGSTDLTFIFGNDPVTEFKVELSQQIKAELLPIFTERCQLIFLCEAIIPSDSLRAMVDRLETLTIGNQLVSVILSENTMNISIGHPPEIWQFEVASGQNHRVQFVWPHLQMLKKAFTHSARISNMFSN